MRSHILIHTGDNPFQCDICPAAFNRKDKLKRHKLIHNAVKKYKCPFKSLTGCEKEFHRADKLKAHIISHSGIKPFKCDKCDRCFTRKPTLQEHMKLHSGDFQVHCGRCGKGFQREKYLRSHRCNSNKGPRRLSKETSEKDDEQRGDEDGESSSHGQRETLRGSSGKRKRKLSLDDGRQTRVVHTKTRQVLMKGPQLVKRSRKSKPKQRSQRSGKFDFIEEDVHTIRQALAVELEELPEEEVREALPTELEELPEEEAREALPTELDEEEVEERAQEEDGQTLVGDLEERPQEDNSTDVVSLPTVQRETVIVLNSSTEADNNIRKAMDDREALMENILSEGDK